MTPRADAAGAGFVVGVGASGVPGMMAIEIHPLLLNLAVGLTLVGWVAVLVCCFLWDRGAGAGHGPAYEPPQADHPVASVPDALGEPDLAPPSTSAQALAEVDRLEALWALPPYEANTRRE